MRAAYAKRFVQTARQASVARTPDRRSEMPANAEVRALLRATWVMLGLLGRPGLPGAVPEGHNTVGVLREHARIAARRLMGLYPPWGHSAEGTHAGGPGKLRMLSSP